MNKYIYQHVVQVKGAMSWRDFAIEDSKSEIEERFIEAKLRYGESNVKMFKRQSLKISTKVCQICYSFLDYNQETNQYSCPECSL